MEKLLSPSDENKLQIRYQITFVLLFFISRCEWFVSLLNFSQSKRQSQTKKLVIFISYHGHIQYLEFSRCCCVDLYIAMVILLTHLKKYCILQSRYIWSFIHKYKLHQITNYFRLNFIYFAMCLYSTHHSRRDKSEIGPQLKIFASYASNSNIFGSIFNY